MALQIYTPAKRKAMAQAFRAAKEYLWDGVGEIGMKTHYICNAIADAQIGGRVSFEGAYAARCEVGHRLGYRATAEMYLMYDLGVPKAEITNQAIQTWRHAWLDALVKEFST